MVWRRLGAFGGEQPARVARERLGSASPPICCRLGAAALACLVQDQWDGERPSPILTPTPGQVERRKRRAIEPLYGGKPSVYSKGVSPQGSRTIS